MKLRGKCHLTAKAWPSQSDPNTIRLRFQGADSKTDYDLHLDEAEDLAEALDNAVDAARALMKANGADTDG